VIDIVLAWLVVFGHFVSAIAPLIASMLTGDKYWLCVKAGNIFASMVVMGFVVAYVIIWALNTVAMSLMNLQ